MKRAVSFVLALLFLPAIAVGGDLPAKYLAAISETGAGLSRGLIFHTPFTDPANPLTLYKGTGPFTFTRAHDATHTATFIHPTTNLVTAADNNQLRIEASGALIELARANLALYSEVLNAANWTALGSGMAVSADNVISPDGNSTADAIIPATGTAAHYLYQAGIVRTSGANLSFSLFAKKSDFDFINVQIDDGLGVGEYLSWNLTTGAVGATAHLGAGFTVVSSFIIPLADSWYRCGAVLTASAVTSLAIALATGDSAATLTSIGDGSKRTYVWGVQLEDLSPFVSSYIPTVATAMTRNVDALTFPTTGNRSDTAGTVSAEVVFSAPLTGGEANQTIIGYTTAQTMPLYTDAGHGASVFDSTNAGYADGPGPTQGIVWKMASRWSSGGIGAAAQGGAVGTAAYDGAFGSGDITVGTGHPAFAYNNPIHIKNLRIWNRAFSDAELQAITR